MLLDDRKSSPGEGKASCNFFPIKCDICFGMTQAGSHRQHRSREEGEHPCGLGWTRWARSCHPGSAGRCSGAYNEPRSTGSRLRRTQSCNGFARRGWHSVRLPGTRWMPNTPLALMLVTAVGAGGPVALGRSRSAGVVWHGRRPWEQAVCPSTARGCLRRFAEQAMPSASEGNPKPQHRTNTRDRTFYPKSACF